VVVNVIIMKRIILIVFIITVGFLCFLVFTSFSHTKNLMIDLEQKEIDLEQKEIENIQLQESFKTKISNMVLEHETEVKELKELPIFNFSPKLSEVEKIVKKDSTDKKRYHRDYFNCVDFSFSLVNAFLKQKVHACVAWVLFDEFQESSHAIVAVNTSDYGVIFIEPQTDKIIFNIKPGDDYCSLADLNCNWTIERIKTCY